MRGSVIRRLNFNVVFLIFTTVVLSTFYPSHAQPSNYSLRFYGHGVSDIDRVKISIDPHVPVDVGNDFTVEFWMKAFIADNNSPACVPNGVNWIYGNIILDRDIYGDGDFGDYGVSLAGGQIAFGVAKGSTAQTICSTMSVADGNWHHIALTRNSTSGQMSIFIDGSLDATGSGPIGDISYRDGRSTLYPNSDPYFVIGAEKHDAGPSYPSYSGFLDELCISTVVRYTSNFSPPSSPFVLDIQTAALYHFDEGPEGACAGTITDEIGSSNGQCKYGGVAPSGPVYSIDTPFTLNQYTISATANPVAGGSVSCRPNPVNHGSTSTCTITTNPGYILQNVTGTCGGNLTGNTYTTNPITADCTVTANFAPNTVTLTIRKVGTGTGTLTSNTAGINCGSDCTEMYNYGTAVILTATPDTGSIFGGWGGDCSSCGTNTTCNITMDTDKTCTATFNLLAPDLTATWLNLSKTIKWNRIIVKGTLRVNNNGTTQSPSGVKISFYISDDGVTFNRQIGTTNLITPIAPGTSNDLPITLYSRTSVTGKYVVAEVDPRNQVIEIDETNNEATFGPLP